MLKQTLDPLTEDFAVISYMIHLARRGWSIDSYCIGKKQGTDIAASKEGRSLLVEAKGARGNPKDKNVVREKFDSGQIKDHLGKAIVKAAELKAHHPQAIIEILHTDTDQISKIVEPVARVLLPVGFGFVFVDKAGNVRRLEFR